MKTQTIDAHGRRWVWNCGWQQVNVRGEVLAPHKRPMGHTTFRRHVPLLDLGNKQHREVLHGMDKPGRMWRRYVSRTCWEHSEYGSCYLLATDGCHAVIELPGDGEHKHVCFENLSEFVGVPLPRRESTSKVKTPGTRKKSGGLSEAGQSLLNKYLSLAKPC